MYRHIDNSLRTCYACGTQTKHGNRCPKCGGIDIGGSFKVTPKIQVLPVIEAPYGLGILALVLGGMGLFSSLLIAAIVGGLLGLLSVLITLFISGFVWKSARDALAHRLLARTQQWIQQLPEFVPDYPVGDILRVSGVVLPKDEVESSSGVVVAQQVQTYLSSVKVATQAEDFVLQHPSGTKILVRSGYIRLMDTETHSSLAVGEHVQVVGTVCLEKNARGESELVLKPSVQHPVCVCKVGPSPAVVQGVGVRVDLGSNTSASNSQSEPQSEEVEQQVQNQQQLRR